MTAENKRFYASILAMAWPVMLEEGLQTAVSYVDSAMVGQLGAYASAAVGITQTPQWLLWGLLRAIGIGLLAYVAQAVGANDWGKVRRAGGQALLLTLAGGTILGVPICLLASYIPGWMGAEADIRGIAGEYLLILCLPMLFRGATVILGSVLRGTGDMRTPMLVNLVVNAVNVVLNFLMIYPTRDLRVFGLEIQMFGCGWGVRGAAIASAISIVVGGVLMLMAFFRDERFGARGTSLRPDGEVLRFVRKVGVPAAAQHIVICMAFVVFVSLVTRLGTTALAAHTIANTAEEAFYIPAYGLQAVAATMAGMAVGARDERQLDRVASVLSRIAFISLAALGALLFFLPEQMMSIFTPDKEVIRQGASVLRIIALSEPFFGILTVAEGLFRGVGDMKAPLYIALFCMWGIRVGGTWLLLSFFSGGLDAVWYCMLADNMVRCGLFIWRIRSGRWKRELDLTPLPDPQEAHG